MDNTKKGRWRQLPVRLGAVLVVFVLVASACSSDGSGTSAGDSGSNDSASGGNDQTASDAGNQPAPNPDDLLQYIGNPDPALCGGKEYTFGYDTFSDTEEFAVQFFKGIERVAAEIGCVQINKLADDLDPVKVVQNVEVFAQQGVDGVLLFNVLGAAGPGQKQVLDAQGIPAVSIVVPLEGYPFVTNDDFSDGSIGGVELGNAYNALDSNGPVYAVIGRFDAQGETGIARMDGVVAGLTQTVPDIQLIEFEASADPPTAQAATAAVLGQIPDGAKILVSAINDGITFALLQAIKQAGREDDAMVVSMTGVNPGGLQFMCQNKSYVGAVGFFPERWAETMIPVLMADIQGADVPEKTIVPTAFIARDKIGDFYPDFVCEG